MIALAVLLIAAAAPAVSAENHIISSLPYSDTKNEQSFDYYSGTVSYSTDTSSPAATGYLIVELLYVQYYTNVHYFMWEAPGNVLTEEGQSTCWYSRPSDGAWKPATLQVIKTRNALGAVTKTVAYVYPLEWDIGTKTGTWSTILYKDDDGVKSNTPLKTVSIAFSKTKYHGSLTKTGGSDNYKGGMYLKLWGSNLEGQKTHVEGYTNLKYTLDIEEFGTSYIVDMIRTIGSTSSTTTITLKDASSAVLFQDTSATDKTFLVSKDKLSLVEVVAGIYTNNYNIALGGDVSPTPSAATVTVYIQNSQTGALLANANLAILASAGGTEVEIINTTLPGGTATYTLQPTGGGSPNPDYYRAVATVPGYTQIVENHSFTLTGPHDVIIEMRPDTGGPLDPDRAYLEFYVRDLHANPIPSASVQCDGRIKTTNSQGYAVFEVAKNATYPYVAKKSGYVAIEGIATVADGPRYVANVVLGPGTVPTYTPTLGPGETPGDPGATPTPDRRTNEQKGQAVIDMIADNAEGIGALALICLLLGLLKLMVKW